MYQLVMVCSLKELFKSINIHTMSGFITEAHLYNKVLHLLFHFLLALQSSLPLVSDFLVLLSSHFFGTE